MHGNHRDHRDVGVNHICPTEVCPYRRFADAKGGTLSLSFDIGSIFPVLHLPVPLDPIVSDTYDTHRPVAFTVSNFSIR